MIKRNRIIEEDLAAIAEVNLPWDSLQGLNILVTGASGFIGGYLVETLAFLNEVKINPPVKIYALARNKDKLYQRFPYLLNRPDFLAVIQDVNTPWNLAEKIDLIFHAASEASPKKYLNFPVDTIKANTVGTINLLEIAKHNKAKFVFLSSGVVYGNNNEQEVSESSFGAIDPLDPRSCYTEGKRLGEAACMAYWKQFDVPTTIARISHTYGPGLSLEDGRVFTDLIADAIAGRDMLIHGDGLSSRPFCYISDMILGLFLVAMNGVSGNAYNIGAADELTILDLAKLIIEISEKKHLKIKFNGEYALNLRGSGHFNINKIKQLGWNPSINPYVGFERMYRYFCSCKE